MVRCAVGGILLISCAYCAFVATRPAAYMNAHALAQRVREMGGIVHWSSGPMSYPPRVTGIDLSDTAVSDSDFVSIADCAAAEDDVFVVNLSGTAVSDAVAPHIRRLGDVAILRIDNTEMTSASFAELGLNRSLIVLDASHLRIEASGLRALSEYSGLRRLVLAGASVGDECASALAELGSVTALDLSGTRITRSGIQEVLRARDDRDVHIQLHETGIMEEDIMAIMSEFPEAKLIL